MSSVYRLAQGGSALTRWTPRPIRHTLGSVIGAGSYIGWRSKRLVTQQNMAQVVGRASNDPLVRRLAFTSWYNYGRYAADFMNFPHLDPEEIDRHLSDQTEGIIWHQYLQQGLDRGKGVLIATAHFGNWDLAGVLAGRYAPLSGVTETFNDPRLNTLLQGQRQEKGVNVIPMEGAPRRILRTLQKNEMVALVVDRPMGAGEGVAITFFGRTAYVPAGTGALAVKSGAAIVPGFVWYGLKDQFFVRQHSSLILQRIKPARRRD